MTTFCEFCRAMGSQASGNTTEEFEQEIITYRRWCNCARWQWGAGYFEKRGGRLIRFHQNICHTYAIFVRTSIDGIASRGNWTVSLFLVMLCIFNLVRKSEKSDRFIVLSYNNVCISNLRLYKTIFVDNIRPSAAVPMIKTGRHRDMGALPHWSWWDSIENYGRPV